MAPPPQPKEKAVYYDLTLSDEGVDYRSATPNATLIDQVIDLTANDDSPKSSAALVAPGMCATTCPKTS
jgi:hypothetical protein